MEKVESKLDIHESKKKLDDALRTLQASKLINKQLILDFDKHLLLEGCGERHRIKTIMALRIMDRWIGKPFDVITSDDMADLIADMRQDKVGRSEKNPVKKRKPLSEVTKANYLKSLKQLFRWMYIKKIYKGKETPETISYFRYKKNANKKQQPLVLSLSQWQLIIEKLSNQKYRCAAMVLFDSGARPEEFANIRKKDVTWDEKSKKYWINIRYNKIYSHPRMIDVPYCTETLKRYLETVKKLKQDEPLFDINMDKFRMVIQFHAVKLFKAKATVYTLRHSSIQHYYDIYSGNLIHLCNRFGWNYDSGAKELQQYANRSKTALPDASELAHQDKIAELANENIKMQAKVDDVIRQLKDRGQFEDVVVMLLSDMAGKVDLNSLGDVKGEAARILKRFIEKKKEEKILKEWNANSDKWNELHWTE